MTGQDTALYKGRGWSQVTEQDEQRKNYIIVFDLFSDLQEERRNK
jgi:hypothetical protein